MVMADAMTAGDLILFISYVRNLNKPLRALSRLSAKVGKAAACGERIGEIFSIEPEEVDLPTATPAPQLQGNISFQEIAFEYDDGVPALTDISFEVRSGERIGLVGRNGAGKTTLMNLLLRFYEPSSGQIELDGTPLTNYTIASVREQLSMALQSTFLFGMSIRENLRFAAPDATDEEMYEVLEAVGADFIHRLPEELDTEISEGGTNFSGGECRKIALAGALLRRTPVLILDEPTTYIDRASRSDLLERLPAVTSGQTTLVITHDPEMLRWFDRVIYLEEGKIAAIGDHGELQSSSLGYRALFPKTAATTISETGEDAS